MSAAGCNNLIESAESLIIPEKEIILTATREALDPGTRSIRLDDGSVWWSPNEEVSIFYGSGSDGGSKFVSMNTSIAETVELQGTIQMSGSGKEFWAVYPYSEDNSCDGTSITTIIPSQQTGVEGNFSDDVFPAMAKGSSTSLPFWNICGGIKFFVSRSDIRSVTFKGNNDEPLAGKVKMVFDADGKPAIAEVLEGESEVTLFAPGDFFKVGKYYYITLLPTALQKGFSISFKAEYQNGVFKSNNQQAIKRSVFGVLKNIDAKVSEWEGSSSPIAVDLGLPSGLKWATCNVGASKPEEYGDFYAWGETQPKTEYRWTTYKWCNGDYNKLTKYCTQSSYWDSSEPMDNKTVLDPEDDAAHVNWGGNWRMPTVAEWTELRENCTWTWTSNYKGTGVAGRIVTSNKDTSRSIFLPAARCRDSITEELVIDLNNPAAIGYYLSSYLRPSDPSHAWFVDFYSGDVILYSAYRYVGQSVRPVYDDLFHPVSSVNIEETDITIEAGIPVTLHAVVSPTNAANQVITWSSSNSTIASVNDSGVVTGYKSGSVTITASCGGKSATCKVTVVISVSSFTLNTTSVKIRPNETYQLIATVIPYNATEQTVTWTSNIPGIATVDSSGLVKGISVGEAKITASCGGKAATAIIIVTSTESGGSEDTGFENWD